MDPKDLMEHVKMALFIESVEEGTVTIRVVAFEDGLPVGHSGPHEMTAGDSVMLGSIEHMTAEPKGVEA